MREYNNQTRITDRSTEGIGGYAEWIALGAIAAGSVAAIVGLTNCSRSAAARGIASENSIDPTTVTAPHGDKLMGAVV